MRYHCDFCEYIATSKSRLRKHVDTQGDRYNCSHCEFSTTKKMKLNLYEDTNRINIEIRCDNRGLVQP